MVYKLYDLTPEEIAIVEGRSNNGNKTRQVVNKQLKAIEVLPGGILREMFDFEESFTGGTWDGDVGRGRGTGHILKVK